MNFVDSIKSGFKNCFRYSGRASRSEYWYFYLFLVLVGLPRQLLQQFFVPLFFEDMRFDVFIVIFIISSILEIVVGISLIALNVRRYHDVGLSGKWFLLMVVVGVGIGLSALWLERANISELSFYILAGIIIILGLIINVVICCKRPTAGDNKYGPNPLLASGEAIKKVYQETKPEMAAGEPIKSYTSQITAVKNKVLTEKSSEVSVSEAKSDLEIKLAEIEDMHERSVITKTERDKLREKVLGLE
jgi:uncharacterized membrane protein YhaH (DUF805 family)